MNTGVVASRYAKALLKYVQETGKGDTVYSQALVLVLRLSDVPQLEDYIQNHSEVDPGTKIELLQSALGEPICLELSRFIQLVCERHRMAYFTRMLHSFISQYRAANNIIVGKLITAQPAAELKGRLEKLFNEKTGARVQLETSVNPGLLGGFVFELSGWMLDASVESRLRKIRRELIDKNRIV